MILCQREVRVTASTGSCPLSRREQAVHYPEGIWHKVLWRWWKNRELEKRPWAAGAQHPGVSKESLWGLETGSLVGGGAAEQGQEGPHRDSRELAEGWEVCPSASLGDENAIESSLLLCWPPGMALCSLQIPFVFGWVSPLWSPELIAYATLLLLMPLVFPAPCILFGFRASGP